MVKQSLLSVIGLATDAIFVSLSVRAQQTPAPSRVPLPKRTAPTAALLASFPVGVGSTWTMKNVSSKAGAPSDNVTYTVTEVKVAPDGRVVVEIERAFKIFKVQTKYQMQYVLEGHTVALSNELGKVTPPRPLFIFPPTPHAKWTWTGFESVMGEKMGYATRNEVIGNEDITVPAGRFKSMHVREVTDGYGSNDYWLVDGVGIVKKSRHDQGETWNEVLEKYKLTPYAPGPASPAASAVDPSLASLPPTRYFPIGKGTIWKFKTSLDTEVYYRVEKVSAVSASEGKGKQARIAWGMYGDMPTESVFTSSNVAGTFTMDDAEVRANTDDFAGKALPDLPLLRFPLRAGDTWSWKGKTMSALGDLPATATFKVIGEESGQTKAGTFMAFRVHEDLTQTKEGVGITLETDRWYAPGVGMIKTVRSIQGQLIAKVGMVEFHAAKAQ